MPHGLVVPVVRLDPELPLPTYARVGDAGLDLLAREDATLAAGGGRALIPTGIALAIPDGYAGFVQPRSGLALRHGVTCLNTPGLIDAGYRDELKVLLVNTDPDRALRGAPGRAHRAAGRAGRRSDRVVTGRRARGREPGRRLRVHRSLSTSPTSRRRTLTPGGVGGAGIVTDRWTVPARTRTSSCCSTTSISMSIWSRPAASATSARQPRTACRAAFTASSGRPDRRTSAATATSTTGRRSASGGIVRRTTSGAPASGILRHLRGGLVGSQPEVAGMP